MTDDQIDHLATRIAENLIRPMRPAADAYPFGRDWGADAAINQRHIDEFDDPRSYNEEVGPLAMIRQRVDAMSRQMTEIAGKLNEHADRVHGHVAMDMARPEISNGATTLKGVPAVQAIFIALDNLDCVLTEVAVAAGRNSTLA